MLRKKAGSFGSLPLAVGLRLAGRDFLGTAARDASDRHGRAKRRGDGILRHYECEETGNSGLTRIRIGAVSVQLFRRKD